MKVSVTYNGGLSKIAEGIGKSMAQAVREAGENVAQRARNSCPVDTGRLRESIEVSGEGNTAVVSANTEYAAYVEFGTSKSAPQPYLVPSLINNSDAVLNAIAATLTAL